MTSVQEKLMVVLLVGAVGFIVVPVIYALIKRIICFFIGKRIRERRYGKALGIFTALLIVSIWCLRYATDYYSVLTDSVASLSPLEEVINSLLGAVAAFTAGGDYREYILLCKELAYKVFGVRWLSSFYGIFASLLNLTAPITGGAIFLELLAGVFPKIRLWFSFLAPFKEKNCFSRLNERSLALANSIVQGNTGFWRPVVVFTDVCFEKGDEQSSELLSAAKALGAICVKDDIKHIIKPKSGKRRFFLISNEEEENLRALIGLSDNYNGRRMRNADIFIFTESDVYIKVESSVREKFLNEYGYKEEELNIYPVQSSRNLIANMLTELPLYEPLVKKTEKVLTVTVTGSGPLATEMFLSTYWFGQILDYKLNINIASKESEASFKERINRINPEILRTAIKNDSLLRYNKNGDCNELYFSLNYIESESLPEDIIKSTDYFFVSVGTDRENLSYAEKLRINVGKANMENPKNTVITYIICDSELNLALNNKKHYCNNRIYMRAFGSLNEVYSKDNIFMTRHQLLAKGIGVAYYETKEAVKEENKKRLKDEYNYRANLARAMHIKYKVFSAGLITASVFDSETDSDHTESVAKACLRYKKEARDLGEIRNKLAYLEHRRWNAFLRVRGFQSVSDYSVYYPETKSYKNIPLKLHPCIRECSESGMNSGDLLDNLSADLMAKGIIDCDFKTYDYPEYDF